MKLITCIISPARLEPLKKALWAAGFRSMTLVEARGLGYGRGHLETGPKEDFLGEAAPRVRLELALRDADVEPALEVMLEAARTGRIGDGKIFIGTLDQVVRVRTGERGDAAL
jgi:nitrogen regulatory protein PII